MLKNVYSLSGFLYVNVNVKVYDATIAREWRFAFPREIIRTSEFPKRNYPVETETNPLFWALSQFISLHDFEDENAKSQEETPV